jgi:hypothetical protein
MKTVAAALALIFAQALIGPAMAQTKPPATKADCEKNKDMKWDEKANGGKGACVKK